MGDWSIAEAGSREEAEKRCEWVGLVRCCKDLGVATELWDPVVVNEIRNRWFVGESDGGKRRWKRKEGRV